MSRSSVFFATTLVGVTLALIQPVSAAKSTSEVKNIARSVTVEIKLKSDPQAVGSGVLINRQGNLYTVVTNRHVICGRSDCNAIAENDTYFLFLADSQHYQVKKSAIRFLGKNNDLDLAIVQFRSNQNYNVVKIADPGSLKTTDKIFTAGFPLKQAGLSFNEGEAIGVVNKRLNGDNGGYTIVYNADTLPGMSGGGVFNTNGQLVAIHGYGDRLKENTDIDNNYGVGDKIGLNRGISVRWLVESLMAIGINLGEESSKRIIQTVRQQEPDSADEHFIIGFNNLIDPGNNIVAGKRRAIQELSKRMSENS
jgi:serine protease Do